MGTEWRGRGPSRARPAGKRLSFRPQLEALEPRWTPAASFNAQQNVSGASSPDSVAMADFGNRGALDVVVANDVSRPDVGMESADNAVTILFSDGKTNSISRTSKKIIAYELVKIISNSKEKCLTKKS